jgi:hypothetical protein
MQKRSASKENNDTGFRHKKDGNEARISDPARDTQERYLLVPGK